MPGRGIGGGETPDAHGEEVHMEEGNLRPSVKGWGKTELCKVDECQH